MPSSITAYIITRYNEDGSVSYFQGHFLSFVRKYPPFYYGPVGKLYLNFQEAYSDYERLIYCLKRIEKEENNSHGENREIDFNDYYIIPVQLDGVDAYSENKIGIYSYQDFLDEQALDETLDI